MTQPLSDSALRAQAFLFAEGGALSRKKLSHMLDLSETDTQRAVYELSEHLRGSGLSIIETEREVTLATAPEAAEAVRNAYEHQLERDIGEAGLEVLAILLYRGASTRTQIDYIRGVNTTSTLRTLLSRGLIERKNTSEDAREYRYAPTTELLAYLGVSNTKELPDYATIRGELAAFEDSKTPFDSYGGTGNDTESRRDS